MNNTVLTKSILFAFLAACGFHFDTESEFAPSVSSSPGDDQPPDTPPEEDGQHFCCESIDEDNPGKGHGCVMIGKEHTGLCIAILYCGGSYNKQGDKVTCID